jgi:hypothetical protein
MSKRPSRSSTETMLELWRPPENAGTPVGCLATTYTFDTGIFDEQCLARFLEIESEPSREDLAFLLERETRLGAAYAGVLVDHTQAGVGHSQRWDVLRVRVGSAKQHAKLALLAWTRHVRVIVASANVTEWGHRYNREVAVTLDSTPQHAWRDQLESAVQFLRSLLAFVPGAAPDLPEIQRAIAFLAQIDRQVAKWTRARNTRRIRQHMVFTVPARGNNPATAGPGFAARSSLGEAVARCRQQGGSPAEAWVASPFFDNDGGTDAATAALCKAMARGGRRWLTFCIPALSEPTEKPIRLAAPASLQTTPAQYSALAGFEVLPQHDREGNSRHWHAKMLGLRADAYTALMAGSSNFTRAGMGIGERRNAEANILTIVERVPHAREPGDLEAVWPQMEHVAEPESAEWLGPKPELEEEEGAGAVPLPVGFLSATYRAGDQRRVVLRFDPAHLPETWSVNACGHDNAVLLDADMWLRRGRPEATTIPWRPVQPPETLLVRWPEGEAVWTLNVEDPTQLPPPPRLGEMTADDMLHVLAASDPGAALRAWAKRRGQANGFDDELDAAVPADLEPLRRHDLRATFLHRIRRRARVLARLRQNLQRPVYSAQALQWRLEGFIGIKPLAERLMRAVTAADRTADDAALTLADFLIVLREVDYEPADGALPKAAFDRIYLPFLRGLVVELDRQISERRGCIGRQVLGFWDRVVERCQV